jgi:hypothetical protein
MKKIRGKKSHAKEGVSSSFKQKSSGQTSKQYKT